MFLTFAYVQLLIGVVRRYTRRTLHRAQSPQVHQGATEAFGAELHALREIAVSPELISDIEIELRWGQMWHDFETGLQAEVDRIFAPALALLDCESFDEVREMVNA